MAKTSNWSIGHFKIIIHIALLHYVICTSAELNAEETDLTSSWKSYNGNRDYPGSDGEITLPTRRQPTWRNANHQLCSRHQDFHMDRVDPETPILDGTQSTEGYRGRPSIRRMLKNQKKHGNKNASRDPTNASGLPVLECGISAQDKQEIVDEHNLLRTMIAQGILPGQPRGINLKKLIWDDKLAVEAENVAKLGGMRGRVQVNDTRFLVGQNSFIRYSTESERPDWVKAITAWFEEHSNYKFGPTTITKKGLHYSQLVWAETYMVGCGRCHISTDHWTYVCNYDPAGNKIGDDPYVKGTEGCQFLC